MRAPDGDTSNQPCEYFSLRCESESAQRLFDFYLIAPEEEEERLPIRPLQPEAVASFAAVFRGELSANEARYLSRRFGQEFRKWHCKRVLVSLRVVLSLHTEVEISGTLPVLLFHLVLNSRTEEPA